MSSISKVIIYPKDISIITGKSYRSAWQLLKKIRTHYHKEPHQVVTVHEFCTYMGLRIDDVVAII